VLNPQRLLVLREVGHRGSVAAAARALGHTEPAIVHHLKALEAETGVKLVRRVGRVTGLTEAGESLLDHADAIVDQLGRAETMLARISRREHGSVTIVAFPSFIGGVLPAALAERAEIALHELSSERWIAGCPRCRRQLERVCGLDEFEPAIDHATDDYVAVMRFVANGLGVALLPRLAIDLAPTPGTAVVQVTGRPHRWIEARAALPVAPATEALLEVLAEVAEGQLAAAATDAAFA
jgi:DNA-binding transcriptional LysR family regulator